MSIIFIDDILFNDSLEERTIRYDNCIVFLILNGTSIFLALIYLYLYFIIPEYQNIYNSLSLFFSIFNLISNSFYFLIFFELYLYEQGILPLTIKIITMFNPLIIICIYFWAAVLTHNLYGYYYRYSNNVEKRFLFYKYMLFILIIIFYIYTLLNINYNDSELLSKKFTFISNYTISFLDIFYSSGLLIILYILHKFYLIMNKKPDFIITEYQEPKERKEYLSTLFKSLRARNIAYILYFLLAFIPANSVMILKYIFRKNNIQSYFFDYLTIVLISFFGTFLFLVKLFDPLLRSFIINFLLFNRENININSDNNKTPLISESEINPPMMIYNNLNITPSPSVDTLNNKRIQKLIHLSPIKTKTKTEGNIKVYYSKISKPYKKYSYNSEPNGDENKKKYEMKILNNSHSIQDEEKLYSDNDINLNINNKNDSSRSTSKFGNNQNESIEYKKDNINLFEDNKKRVNFNLNIHSFGKNEIDKKDILKPLYTNNERNHSITLIKTMNQQMINRTKNIILNKNKKSYKSFHVKKILTPSKSSTNVRSNSNNINLKNKKINQTNRVIGSRSITKTRFDFYHEEITSFASMNYHQELNENLLRMIAISISVNECRKYDKDDKYKKYYKLTVPWENKKIYTETTKNIEYTEDNLPDWLGIKGEAKFTNIQFKIMAYSPFVFHHIRLIDNLSIDDLLLSLHPIHNMKKIKKMKVTGGRGNNSLFCTWDKKIILKTIDRNEKRILFDGMIKDYHCFMREQRSLLSRIYGLYKIELIDKGPIYVIVQRNMDDLPFETKLLSFDFKGSTVDRQVILKEDVFLEKQKLWLKYNNKVLKDKDLNIIGLKFILDYNNWRNIISYIESDSSFLEELGITDYSLIVFIHKYRKEDLEKNKESNRIIGSKDHNYIFNFSIVDYLGTYNFIKKGEKITKSFFGYINKAKDTNFSVLDPKNYADRFRKFCKKIIKDE